MNKKKKSMSLGNADAGLQFGAAHKTSGSLHTMPMSITQQIDLTNTKIAQLAKDRNILIMNRRKLWM